MAIKSDGYMRALLKRLVDAGWRLGEVRGSGHRALYSPAGEMVIIASSPSDQKSRHQVEKVLRKYGFDTSKNHKPKSKRTPFHGSPALDANLDHGADTADAASDAGAIDRPSGDYAIDDGYTMADAIDDTTALGYELAAGVSLAAGAGHFGSTCGSIVTQHGLARHIATENEDTMGKKNALIGANSNRKNTAQTTGPAPSPASGKRATTQPAPALPVATVTPIRPATSPAPQTQAAPQTQTTPQTPVVTSPPASLRPTASSGQQETKVEIIDASLARDLLSRNTSNRSISDKLVDAIARDIVQGRWMLTHQGIALDPDFNLLDGQHRLLAIMKANRAVPICVTYNVQNPNQAAFGIIDTNNRPRSARDITSLTRDFGGRGSHVVGICNAAVKTIARFGGTSTAHRYTNAELGQLLDVFQSDILAVVDRVGSSKGLRQAGVVGAIALARPIGPELIDAIVDRLRSKINMSMTLSGLWNAIDRLSRDRESARTSLGIITLRAVVAELRGQTDVKSFTVREETDITNDATLRSVLYQRKQLGLPEIPLIRTFYETDAAAAATGEE